jgi:hypothetical protein
MDFLTFMTNGKISLTNWENLTTWKFGFTIIVFLCQIVCATGEYVDFYAKTFNKSEKEEQIKSNKYKAQLQPRIEIFNWECHLDEDHFDNTDLGQPDDYETIEEYLESKILFEKLMKKPHKTVKFKEPIGDAIESYSFEKGKIWIGEKK